MTLSKVLCDTVGGPGIFQKPEDLRFIEHLFNVEKA